MQKQCQRVGTRILSYCLCNSKKAGCIISWAPGREVCSHSLTAPLLQHWNSSQQLWTSKITNLVLLKYTLGKGVPQSWVKPNHLSFKKSAPYWNSICSVSHGFLISFNTSQLLPISMVACPHIMKSAALWPSPGCLSWTHHSKLSPWCSVRRAASGFLSWK